MTVETNSFRMLRAEEVVHKATSLEETGRLLPPSLIPLLNMLDWQGTRYELPDGQVLSVLFIPEAGGQELASQVAERAYKVLTFLQATDKKFDPLTLIFEPYMSRYDTSASTSLYDPAFSTAFVKSKAGIAGVDHVLAHWAVSKFTGVLEKSPGILMIQEGFAEWVAYSVKSGQEIQALKPLAEYHNHTFCPKGQEYGLDTQFTPKAATVFGALLCEVLVEELGEKPEILARHLLPRLQGQETITGWLKTCGFGEAEIKRVEEKWKSRIEEQDKRV